MAYLVRNRVSKCPNEHSYQSNIKIGNLKTFSETCDFQACGDPD